MRRVVMMLGMAMLLVFVAAGVALAITKDCGDNLPCEGTDNEDVLHEREGTVKDVMYGFGDHDVLDANNYFSDRDRLFGGGGPDKLLANDKDGRDVLRGGQGRDRCFGDQGDRFVNCEEINRALAASVDPE
jgi:RTX calcium-binding nonapeptide repeat (4 copies)